MSEIVDSNGLWLAQEPLRIRMPVDCDFSECMVQDAIKLLRDQGWLLGVLDARVSIDDLFFANRIASELNTSNSGVFMVVSTDWHAKPSSWEIKAVDHIQRRVFLVWSPGA